MLILGISGNLYDREVRDCTVGLENYGWAAGMEISSITTVIQLPLWDCRHEHDEWRHRRNLTLQDWIDTSRYDYLENMAL